MAKSKIPEDGKLISHHSLYEKLFVFSFICDDPKLYSTWHDLVFLTCPGQVSYKECLELTHKKHKFLKKSKNCYY